MLLMQAFETSIGAEKQCLYEQVRVFEMYTNDLTTLLIDVESHASAYATKKKQQVLSKIRRKG